MPHFLHWPDLDMSFGALWGMEAYLAGFKDLRRLSQLPLIWGLSIELPSNVSTNKYFSKLLHVNFILLCSQYLFCFHKLS